jgi:flagellar hook-length control protein FliK
MPEITPIAAALPSAPAPVAGVAPVVPAASDISASDFMGQLTAALKSLKGLAAAVKGLPTAPGQADATLPLAGDGAAKTQDSPTAASASSASTPSDEVTELMAALGLILVPAPQTALLPTDAKATPGLAPAAHALLAPQTPLPPTPATPGQTPPTPADPATPDLQTTTSHTPVKPEAGKPTDAPAADAPTAPTPAEASTASPQQPTQAHPVVQPNPEQPSAPVLAQVPPQAHNAFGGDGSFQQSDSGDRHHASHKTGQVESAAPERAEPMPERMYASVSAAGSSAPAAPADAPSADVASQIAQQVDLYRLPGNKGVRIQLHPEDLGGVQVTMRYATGGHLELHINVEHAATGNLVQAGLSQLRDALATQGFQPDRMVMSITAPSGAHQMDFSSNNGNSSYRSDSGLNAFTQDGQSDQQRSDREASRGWTSTGDAGTTAVTPDDSSRAATSASAASSLIDYRV